MANHETSPAIDELVAWLVSSFDSTDSACKELLEKAVDACDNDQLALFSMLGWLELFAPQCNRDKWLSMTRELERMEVRGELVAQPAVKTQLLRLKLRFPSADLVVASKVTHVKRPMLRTANSLEVSRPSILSRSARVLRRALTSEDNDRRLPLLERTVTLSQRSGNAMTSSLKKSFLSRMSLVLQGGVEDTYFCFICFENAPDSHGFTLSMCGHRFCRDCLLMYLELKIRDAEVYPTCFHDVEDSATSKRVACGAPIISLDIEAIVSPEVWTKYERFKFNKEFEHARQCPYCGHSQNCDGPEHPECVCEKCRRGYCFIHSNAHAGGSCADFERANLEAEKLNRTAIAKFAKPCPGCKSNVEKNGGCNHMTCVACQTSFCWICGKTVENVTAPDHFAWWNISGCAGQQLTDVDNQSWVERVGWCFFRVLFLTICVPVATVITLALTIMTGCCIPCVCWIHEDPKQTFLGTVNTIALYVQLLVALVVLGPLSLVAFVVRGLRYVLCACCCCWARAPRFSEDDDANVFVVGGDFERSLS